MHAILKIIKTMFYLGLKRIRYLSTHCMPGIDYQLTVGGYCLLTALAVEPFKFIIKSVYFFSFVFIIFLSFSTK